MTKKEIILNGNKYPVIFTMQTIMGFEDIIGHSFLNENFATFKPKVAIIIAAHIATLGENEDTKIKFDDFSNIDKMEGMNEIIAAFNVVMELANEFFHVPAIEKERQEKDSKKKGKKERDEKN